MVIEVDVVLWIAAINAASKLLSILPYAFNYEGFRGMFGVLDIPSFILPYAFAILEQIRAGLLVN